MKDLLHLPIFTAIIVALPAGSPAADELYEVTVENEAKSALTSVVWATHGKQARFFKRGKRASKGVAELAKDGVTSIAKKELKAQQKGSRGVHTVGEAGGISGGGKTKFQVRTDSEHRYLSWATMAVCSNDTFAGQDSLRLPKAVNQTTRKMVRALDAGAEVNTESKDDVPCLGAHGVGPEESKKIRLSDAIRGDADLSKKRGWGKYIARITVKRIR